MRECAWTYNKGYANINGDRNQMAQEEPGVCPNLTSKDSMPRSASIEGDRAKLHDVGCHIIHNACCEAGLKSQREVVVPALATEKLSEPRVNVDAWGHLGLPYIRLDFTVLDAEAIQYSSAMRKAQDTAPAAAQAEKTKENKYGKAKG